MLYFRHIFCVTHSPAKAVRRCQSAPALKNQAASAEKCQLWNIDNNIRSMIANARLYSPGPIISIQSPTGTTKIGKRLRGTPLASTTPSPHRSNHNVSGTRNSAQSPRHSWYHANKIALVADKTTISFNLTSDACMWCPETSYNQMCQSDVGNSPYFYMVSNLRIRILGDDHHQSTCSLIHSWASSLRNGFLFSCDQTKPTTRSFSCPKSFVDIWGW